MMSSKFIDVKDIGQTIGSEEFERDLMAFRNACGSFAGICSEDDTAEEVFERWEEAFMAACDLGRSIDILKDTIRDEMNQREDLIEENE